MDAWKIIILAAILSGALVCFSSAIAILIKEYYKEYMRKDASKRKKENNE